MVKNQDLLNAYGLTILFRRKHKSNAKILSKKSQTTQHKLWVMFLHYEQVEMGWNQYDVRIKAEKCSKEGVTSVRHYLEYE